MTIKLTLWGTLLGFALGVLLAVGRLSNNPVLQVISWTYIWAFRSIPLIVQLLFWFNIAYLYQTMSVGIPFGPGFFEFEVSGVISGFTAAVIGLALHQAAYSAEIIRAGIISVDHGQIEAANALGIPRLRQFFRIVLPQAMRSILPNAANEVISLFKGAQPCAATSGCVTRTARAKESAHHDHHTRSVHRGVAAVALRAS